ncbi:MAG: YveK family protein [Anaerolineae bacterium]|jgi:capsular polysaccharide biosynthesis protein
MELREYWRILRRYVWLIVLVVGFTAVTSLALKAMRPAQTTYAASVRLTVGMEPEKGNGEYYTYDRYYTWLASEYLVDDLSEVVRSATFAAAVSEKLAERGITVHPGEISGATMPVKQHRILTLSVSGTDPARVQAVAEAATEVLRQRSSEFLAQLGSENAAIHVIDPPAVGPVPPSLRERLDLPLRLGLALAAAVALAFVLDYADDSVRSARDLEGLGVAVLGSLPRGRGLPRGTTNRR